MFIGSRRSHAHIKGGWPHQMRLKMAGKFKTTTSFLHYKPAYMCISEITHSQSKNIRGVADEYNP